MQLPPPLANPTNRVWLFRWHTFRGGASLGVLAASIAVAAVAVFAAAGQEPRLSRSALWFGSVCPPHTTWPAGLTCVYVASGRFFRERRTGEKKMGGEMARWGRVRLVAHGASDNLEIRKPPDRACEQQSLERRFFSERRSHKNDEKRTLLHVHRALVSRVDLPLVMVFLRVTHPNWNENVQRDIL